MPKSNESSNDTRDDFVDEVDEDRAKRFEYLLKQTEFLTHFIKSKGNETQKTTNKRKPLKAISNNSRKRKKDDNDNVLGEPSQEEATNNVVYSQDEILEPFQASPDYIKNGEMRKYQVFGLNWLISLYDRRINGILADEMGLGKTLQTISLLGYLKHFKKVDAYHMVIVPLSTIQNWMNEFAKWCPSLHAVQYSGDKERRKAVFRSELLPGKWDVCVTSYEICRIEKFKLKKFDWCYIIIDEAHRIKNENTNLSTTVREFNCTNRLLLTGTPLQNNLHELWSLLNFLLPDVFDSADDFDNWFDTKTFLNNEAIAERLQAVVKPFVLRRVKSIAEPDLKQKIAVKVFVRLSKMQREWYKKVLMRNIDIINNLGEKKIISLNSLWVQLRKVSNHPYLFQGAEAGPPYVEGMHLITNASKMMILDKMLAKLKAQGSRVLIFSQMSRVLDLLEDYCDFRGHKFCRLDGKVGQPERVKRMNEFNAPNSDIFIFMMTTRAGGLGINLATADTVIIYDIDWNPQSDLQAEDRAHRIGQKKQVRVFRLITENSIEEHIQKRCEEKLQLDKMVMNKGLTDAEILRIVRADAQQILDADDHELTDDYYNEIIERIGL